MVDACADDRPTLAAARQRRVARSLTAGGDVLAPLEVRKDEVSDAGEVAVARRGARTETTSA